MKKQLFIFLMIAMLLCSFLVGCGDATLSSVVVKTQPNKVTYEVGESFKVDGAKLELTFSDGSTQEVEVTQSMIASEVKFDTKGTKVIEVTYTHEGVTKTATITVNVKDTLGDARTDAEAEVKGYKATETTNDAVALYITTLRTDAIKAIGLATDTDAINAVVKSFKASVDAAIEGFKADEALQTAKAEAITAINACEQDSALDSVKFVRAAAIAKINAAVSKEAVEDILATTIKDIQALAGKGEAIGALDKARNEAIEIIKAYKADVEYDASTATYVGMLRDNAVSNVKIATNKEAIDTIVNAFKANIDAQKTGEEAKAIAAAEAKDYLDSFAKAYVFTRPSENYPDLAELEAYLKKDVQTTVNELLAAAKEKIDACESAEEMQKVVAETTALIDAQYNYVDLYAVYVVENINAKFDEKYAAHRVLIPNFDTIYGQKELLNAMILRCDTLAQIDVLKDAAEENLDQTVDLCDKIVQLIMQMEFVMDFPEDPANDAEWANGRIVAAIEDVVASMFSEDFDGGELSDEDFAKLTTLMQFLSDYDFTRYNREKLYADVKALVEASHYSEEEGVSNVDLSKMYEDLKYWDYENTTIEVSAFADGKPFDSFRYDNDPAYRETVDDYVASLGRVQRTDHDADNGITFTIATTTETEKDVYNSGSKRLQVLALMEVLVARMDQLAEARDVADGQYCYILVDADGRTVVGAGEIFERLANCLEADLLEKLNIMNDESATEAERAQAEEAYNALLQVRNIADGKEFLHSDWAVATLAELYPASEGTLVERYQYVEYIDEEAHYFDSVEQVIQIALDELAAWVPGATLTYKISDAMNFYNAWVAEFDIDEVNYDLVKNHEALFRAYEDALQKLYDLTADLTLPVIYTEAYKAKIEAAEAELARFEANFTVEETDLEAFNAAKDTIRARRARYDELQAAHDDAFTRDEGLVALFNRIHPINLCAEGRILAAEAEFARWYEAYHLNEEPVGDETEKDFNVKYILGVDADGKTYADKIVDARAAYKVLKDKLDALIAYINTNLKAKVADEMIIIGDTGDLIDGPIAEADKSVDEKAVDTAWAMLNELRELNHCDGEDDIPTDEHLADELAILTKATEMIREKRVVQSFRNAYVEISDVTKAYILAVGANRSDATTALTNEATALKAELDTILATADHQDLENDIIDLFRAKLGEVDNRMKIAAKYIIVKGEDGKYTLTIYAAGVYDALLITDPEGITPASADIVKVIVDALVGDGEVTLKNFDAQSIEVLGGGAHSVILTDCKFATLTINKTVAGEIVTVKLNGATDVTDIIANSEATVIVEDDAKVGKLAAKEIVTIENNTETQFPATSEKGLIHDGNVDADAYVASFVLDGKTYAFASLKDAIAKAIELNVDTVSVVADTTGYEQYVITAGLKLIGVAKADGTKPIVYGNFTINAPGAVVTIEGLKIVHTGMFKEGVNAEWHLYAIVAKTNAVIRNNEFAVDVDGALMTIFTTGGNDLGAYAAPCAILLDLADTSAVYTVEGNTFGVYAFSSTKGANKQSVVVKFLGLTDAATIEKMLTANTFADGSNYYVMDSDADGLYTRAYVGNQAGYADAWTRKADAEEGAPAMELYIRVNKTGFCYEWKGAFNPNLNFDKAPSEVVPGEGGGSHEEGKGDDGDYTGGDY